MKRPPPLDVLHASTKGWNRQTTVVFWKQDLRYFQTGLSATG
jgi:hypothetical protein